MKTRSIHPPACALGSPRAFGSTNVRPKRCFTVHSVAGLWRSAALAVLLGLLGTHTATAQIEWRVSVKLILDENGNRPPGSLNDRVAVENQIFFANDVLARSGRGYRMRLVEYEELSGLSQWYVSGDGEGLEAAAKADPVRYRWNFNAINVYIHKGDAGGCYNCFSDGGIILLGDDQEGKLWTILHESGHFFNLRHTHQGANCGDKSCSECSNPSPGNDDNIADTLPDHQCFDEEDLAQNSFGKSYAALTASERAAVDRTRYNIMSYHGDRDRFTSDQLDVMTEDSNNRRRHVATGETVFVDDDEGGLFNNGSLNNPYQKLKNGIDAADPGDIVLMRPGSYTEDRILRKAIALRATRGNAIIRAR